MYYRVVLLLPASLVVILQKPPNPGTMVDQLDEILPPYVLRCAVITKNSVCWSQISTKSYNSPMPQ